MTEAQDTKKKAPTRRDDATPAHVLISRVRWLVNLRWAEAGVILALALAVLLVLDVHRPGVTLALLTLVPVGVNACVLLRLWRLKRRPPADLRKVLTHATNAQIAVDLIVLTAVLAVMGGVLSPLVVVIVLHVAVAASLLPRRAAYAQAIWVSILYSALVLYDAVAPYSAFSHVGSWFLQNPNWTTIDRLWLAGSMAAVLAAVLLLIVHFIDAILSRLRRINRRLTDSNRQLAALDLTKSRFLRVSSHQLRSPLAAIHSLLSAIQEAGECSARQQDLIRKIQNRTEQAMAQVDEMMLLSTVQEKGAETRETQPKDLDEVLLQAVSDFAEEAQNKNVRLSASAESRAMVAAWDDALETVFEHLLSNAVKYTPAGGGVTVSSRWADGWAAVEVADTGIGIPRDQQGQLFREFFRATNARQMAGGTGIGLALVKAIVDRLDGTLAVESKEGEGTTVRLRLKARGREAPQGRFNQADRFRRVEVNR